MKPIFIGGCERSGTTLLAALLAGHSRVVAPPEAQFFLEGLAASRRAGGNAMATFATFVSNDWRYQLWGLPPTLPLELAATYSRPIELMVGLARAYAGRLGEDEANLWVDHTPMNIGYATTLLTEFDTALMIHLVRDPRAVVASMLPLDWGASSARAGARWWLSRIAMGLAAEVAFPGRVVRVHYEDLVRDTSSSLEWLCSLVGFPFDATMTEAVHKQLPAYTRKQHALVGQPVDPTRVDAWRSTLAERDITTIEGELGDSLGILGYNSTTTTPTIAGAVSAQEFLRGALSNALQRLRHSARVRRTTKHAS